MGLHFPNHDSYFFHISICYYTKDPTPEEEQQLKDFVDEANAYIASKHISFTVQQPELTFFDNMFCFNPFRIPRNGPVSKGKHLTVPETDGRNKRRYST